MQLSLPHGDHQRVMQMRQLEVGRKQLKASQAELERSRKTQVEMTKAMSWQAYYATVSTRVAFSSLHRRHTRAARSVPSEALPRLPHPH